MLHHLHIDKQSTLRVIIATLLSMFVSLCSIHTTQASDKTNASDLQETKADIINDDVAKVSAHLSTGFLTGKANELVFRPAGSNNKLSHLTWTLKNVFMIGGGIAVQPSDWLKIKGDLFVKASEGSNDMDDYDWLYSTDDWSHWSHHEDVKLTKGNIFDINAELTFYQHEQATLSAIIGFRHDNWEWEARGGEFTYSRDSFRDTSGTFTPGELGITYEQTFDVPYIGIGFQADLDALNLSGRLIGSFLSTASDKDHHHLRNLYYEREYDLGTMVGFDIAGAYKFTDHLALTAKFTFNKYFETDGDMIITNLTTGNKTLIRDNSGIDNQTNLFFISLVYTF